MDAQGETVDYAGRTEPYEIRVAAAEWRLVLDAVLACRALGWSVAREVGVRATHASFIAVPLAEGYAFIARLAPWALCVSSRAIAEVVRELSREGGFALPAAWSQARWARVEVRATPRPARRPLAVWHDGRWCDLEILGRFVPEALGHHEVGYRARLEAGADLTLVREPPGIWYADGLPDV